MKEKTRSQYSVEIPGRGYYDTRNKLNDLTGKEWIGLTTTIWNANSKKYPLLDEKDLLKLINLFTKKSQNVLIKGFKNNALTKSNRNTKTTNKNMNDYIIINCIIEKKQISNYINILEDKAKEAITAISSLNEKKYITLVVNEFQVKGITVNSTLYFTKIFEGCGLRLKGKVNLLYENGDIFEYKEGLKVENKNIFLIHFRKITEQKINFQPIKKFRSLCINKNRLNNKPAKENISNIYTSVSKMDTIGKSHPAPFSPEDISILLNIFTNKGDLVIDPFVGVGSTLIAALKNNRKGVGIDLNPEYIDSAKIRITQFGFSNLEDALFINGDSLKEVKKVKGINYCVTSPPYHNILKNKGNGIRHDKSQSRQGIVYYSESKNDLGNQKDFNDYMGLLIKVMKDMYINLPTDGFVSMVMSDFTVNKIEQNVVGILIEEMSKINYLYSGTFILNQTQKSIYPFGYPFDYVINHTNQYVVNFKK